MWLAQGHAIPTNGTTGMGWRCNAQYLVKTMDKIEQGEIHFNLILHILPSEEPVKM